MWVCYPNWSSQKFFSCWGKTFQLWKSSTFSVAVFNLRLAYFFFCLSLVHKYNIWPTSDFVHFPPPSVFLLRRDLCHLWRKKPSKQTLEVGQLYHCLHAAFLPLCLLNASQLVYATIRGIISAASLYKGTILSGSRSWVAEVWNLFTVESPCWPKMGSLTWWLICSTALSELSRSPLSPNTLTVLSLKYLSCLRKCSEASHPITVVIMMY